MYIIDLNKEQINFIQDFISGGLAGTISKIVTAPIERVKLLMQTQIENTKLKKNFKGIIHCIRSCVKHDGVLSLWRGNLVNIIRYFPTQALNFSFKEKYQRIFHIQNTQNVSKYKIFWASLLSGGLAGCTTAFFVYPLDFARTRIGVDLGKSPEKRQFKGFIDCLRKVYISDGIRGVYKGFGICLFGIFFYRAMYFGIYDSGKILLMNDNQKNSFFYRFFFAQFVVIFSETVAYPTDTVKRKMMMQSARGDQPILYKNTWECFKKMYNHKGFYTFYIGNTSSVLRSIGSSLCLVLYDEISSQIKKQ